jgi:hypothetical protein
MIAQKILVLQEFLNNPIGKKDMKIKNKWNKISNR